MIVNCLKRVMSRITLFVFIESWSGYMKLIYGFLPVVTLSPRWKEFRPEIPLVVGSFEFENNWGYFSFIWSSRSQVNSGPRLAFHRTFTIGMRLCLSLLTSWSMISTGSFTKLRFGFTCISSKGTTRDSSDRHFFRFDTWKVQVCFEVLAAAGVCKPQGQSWQGFRTVLCNAG